MLYIHRIRIRNLKCFSDVDVSLDIDGDSVPWGVFVGDNGTGKTALLRSIAMGLCDESSAAGLMKEAAEGYIRRGKKKATITLELRRPAERESFRIETWIEKERYPTGSFERLRQKTDPPKDFPWNEIFISAYGAGRGTGGTGDIAEYSGIDAVYNLFNYGEGLQNPELTIRRLSTSKTKKQIRDSLQSFLGTGTISFTKKGVIIDGAWGKKMPLRDLADGYKSTFLWLADFLGWALSFNDSWEGPASVEGTLLVDELEQHLHATWQRSLVGKLKRLFPKVQILTTTHSPLIASSVGGFGTTVSDDKLFLLEGNPVTIGEHPHMRGDRVDQVLASKAFRYLVEVDDGVEEVFQRASELADNVGSRSEDEEREYGQLLSKIRSLKLDSSTTVFDRQKERRDFQQLKERVGRMKRLEVEDDPD